MFRTLSAFLWFCLKLYMAESSWDLVSYKVLVVRNHVAAKAACMMMAACL
jgi:hypothetical protein